MAKRMSDDEVMDYTYNKLFGDLDNIQSGELFNKEESKQDDAPNAKSEGMSGISLTITPIMAGAKEGGRTEKGEESCGDECEEEEDKYKGLSKISPLMSQMHGDR
jgi:hypothetical protein